MRLSLSSCPSIWTPPSLKECKEFKEKTSNCESLSPSAPWSWCLVLPRCSMLQRSRSLDRWARASQGCCEATLLKQEQPFSHLCSSSEQRSAAETLWANSFTAVAFYLNSASRRRRTVLQKPVCGDWLTRPSPGSFLGFHLTSVAQRKWLNHKCVCVWVCVGWALFQELVVMGAPGSYYWTGTIKVYNLTSDSFYSPNKENVDSHRYSYLGS